MKVFLSHSSRAKPLVREVRSLLPEHINSWIDEKELILGDSVQVRIQDAIESEADYVVVFLDEQAARSEWVRKELDWAREEESALKRPFVLPILIDDVALEGLEWLHGRLYLKCHGYSESDVRTLANELSASLFSLLSRDLERLRSTPKKTNDSLSILDKADQLLQAAAHDIRVAVLPYRKANPLRLSQLQSALSDRGSAVIADGSDLHELLARLRDRKLLSGIVITSGSIYVEEEHLNWRLQEEGAAKQLIVDYVTEWIEDGQVIFVDGGSTALRICRNICRAVRFRQWDKLTIVTNSAPVLAELSTVANELGLDDYDPRLQVFMVGGRMRMNAGTVVKLDSGASSIDALAQHLGGWDIAFCGTNGVAWPLGCTTTAVTQADGKHRALLNARRRVIMADSTKFDVRQDESFASFDMKLEIATNVGSNRTRIDEFASLLVDTSSQIVVVPGT